MSRYIDADAVRQYIFRPYSNEESYSNTDIEKMLNSAPSIDIVFCKECNNYVGCHCESEVMWGSIYGEIAGCEYMVREPDDFCSYGERREP